MNEYIDRNELLKTINENVAEAHNERCAQVLEAILEAPIADVVAVVRCKDCVYADCLPSGLFRCRKHSVYSMFRNSILNVRHEDYCSFGERKEQNEG